jgi:dihydroorotate dehydrogenase electron transfer subunit
MEQHMGCAMGVCLGCVVKTRHGYRRVCRDGPVFPADELQGEGTHV